MSYNCSASLITINGEGSVAAPIDFDDICTNCPTQVTKLGTLQFRSTANWNFVNSHFKDTNKQIHFNKTNTLLYVDINSSFQLGDKDANGNVYNGCAMKFDSCQLSFWSGSGQAGDVKLYDSLLDTPGAFYRVYRSSTQVFEMIGCTVQAWNGGRIQGDGTSIIKNCYIHNGSTYSFGPRGAGGGGGSSSTSVGTVDDLTEVVKYVDTEYTYFSGYKTVGWQVNRWDIDTVRMIATGSGTKPSSLAECQALSYN